MVICCGDPAVFWGKAGSKRQAGSRAGLVNDQFVVSTGGMRLSVLLPYSNASAKRVMVHEA